MLTGVNNIIGIIMAKNQLYTLIQWIEDSTYTAGIPVEWIKYFDYDTYVSGDYDINHSFPIECRETKKEPHGGWPCYDGVIIDISGKLKEVYILRIIFLHFINPII